MATKKKRTKAVRAKKATKGATGRGKKAAARGGSKGQRKRERYKKLGSRPAHAELFVFLDAMRDKKSNAADLFAAGQIGAALDAAGVKLSAKQRELAIKTLESISPDKLAEVAELLRVPDIFKVAVN